MSARDSNSGSELARRWAVAFVGIPILLGLLYVGGWVLGIPIALLAALGAKETYRLAEQKGTRPFRWLGAAAAAGLVLLAVAYPTFASFAPPALTALVVLALIALVLAMARGASREPLAAVAVTLFGTLYVGFPLAFMVLLHALPTIDAWGQMISQPWIGLLVVTLPLTSTFIGDTSAFFAGSKWGRAKILPSVSPNKSWVGSVAGLLGASGGAALWYLVAEPYLPGLPIGGVAVAAAVGAALGVGAQVGDFAESLLKRDAGVKDSGALFPGHGGVLDRLDASLVTLPLAYLMLRLLAGGP